MKKIVNIIYILTVLMVVSSCKSALEAPTKSSLDESVIFSTPSLAEGAVAGIFHSFGETNSYRGRFLVYYGINTDAEVYNTLKSVDDDKAKLSNYNTNVANGQMNTSDNGMCLIKKK